MSTNDHSQLINRNEPNQHMAKSIVYAGKALNEQLDTMKAGIAERPTAAQVADSYYDKNEIDTQLSAMGGTDHSQLLNRDQPNQHLAKAISYNGAPLNAQLNTMKADIADRVTAAQVADGYYGKSEIDAQMATKAGTDHAALDNRDAADQHPAEAITYNGAALTVELDAVRASVAERPTAAEVADGYYGKSEIDAQLAGKAGTDHAALDNRDAADQHPAAAISYNGAALDTELDAVRADVATKVTASDVADNHYTKAEADAHLAGKSGIYDATCVTSGTRHDLTIPAFPAPSPATFTVRVTMDADYRSGNTFQIDGTEFAARTQTNDPAPDDVVKSGATIEIVFDANRGLAFFRGGVGAKANGWNISVGGETPVTEGIHVPDAVRPSRICIDNGFKLIPQKIKQIECGSYNSMLLLHTGEVLTCGYVQDGRVGNESTLNLGFIKGIPNVVEIACSDFDLLLMDDGTVFSRGDNRYGALAREVDSVKPPDTNIGIIPNFHNIIAIASGKNHSVFLRQDGTVFTCGHNEYGQLGRIVESGSPTRLNLGPIPELTGIVGIAASEYNSYLIDREGRVYSCGHIARLGRTGNEANESVTNIGCIPQLDGVKSISTSSTHALFLKHDGSVLSCGVNNWWSLGKDEPDLGVIPGLENVVSVAAGFGHSIFCRADGTVLTCGLNTYGQLGRNIANGSTKNHNLGAVDSIENAIQCAAGYNISFILTKDDAVFTCGANYNGQLGRIVLTGSNFNVNLGEIDLLKYAIDTPLAPREEKALLVKHFGAEFPNRVCVYDDGFTSTYLSPSNVYQIENGEAVEKTFSLHS